MIRKYIKNEKLRIVLLIFVSIIGAIITSLVPYISGMFIDSLISNPDMKIIYNYCIFFLIVMIITIILGYVNSICGIKVKNNINFNFIDDIISIIYEISYMKLKDMNMSYLVQRINQDCSTIVNFYFNIILGGIVNIIQTIFIGYLLLQINIQIFILVIVLNVFYWILYSIFKKRVYLIKFELKEKSDKLFASLFEQLRYIKLIKIFDIEIFLKRRLYDNYKLYYSTSINAQKINYCFSSIQTLLKYLAQIILFIFGGIEIIKGKLSIGIYSIMAGYFTSLNDSLKFFIDSLNNYIEVKVSIKRINDIKNLVDKDEQIKTILDTVTNIKLDRCSIYIADKKVISDFSYEFNIGSSYCIYGMNGSGKTTLVETIIGLNENNFKGNIKYNDIDINNLNMKNVLLNKISYLPQTVDIIEDSVVNNITLSQKCNFEKLQQLILGFNLEQKNIASLINFQNNNISGGEIKKIGIIRSILKKSDVYIFDEPLASLDFEAKRVFHNIVNQLKKEAIVIVISHEDITENNYDEIIRLEEIK